MVHPVCPPTPARSTKRPREAPAAPRKMMMPPFPNFSSLRLPLKPSFGPVIPLSSSSLISSPPPSPKPLVAPDLSGFPLSAQECLDAYQEKHGELPLTPTGSPPKKLKVDPDELEFKVSYPSDEALKSLWDRCHQERAAIEGSTFIKIGETIFERSVLGKGDTATVYKLTLAINRSPADGDAIYTVKLPLPSTPKESGYALKVFSGVESCTSFYQARSSEISQLVGYRQLGLPTPEIFPFIDISPSKIPDFLLQQFQGHCLMPLYNTQLSEADFPNIEKLSFQMLRGWQETGLMPDLKWANLGKDQSGQIILFDPNPCAKGEFSAIKGHILEIAQKIGAPAFYTEFVLALYRARLITKEDFHLHLSI